MKQQLLEKLRDLSTSSEFDSILIDFGYGDIKIIFQFKNLDTSKDIGRALAWIIRAARISEKEAGDIQSVSLTNYLS